MSVTHAPRQGDMAAMKAKQFEEDAAAKVHRIRITLTSRDVKNLEKGEWRAAP